MDLKSNQFSSNSNNKERYLNNSSNNVKLEFEPPDYSASSASASVLTASVLSTFAIYYLLKNTNNARGNNNFFGGGGGFDENEKRSTRLPGLGLFGDRINEFIGIFLNSLAVYSAKGEGDCRKRFFCEANQRATEYGRTHGLLMYFSSLFVSFWLRGQRVSESIEAMRRGRHGENCFNIYPKCKFSL